MLRATHGCRFSEGRAVSISSDLYILQSVIAISRQKNIDWAVSEALRYFLERRTLLAALILYDIVCQYNVYFKERIKRHETKALFLPPSACQILYGIGLFHVHGHQATCFPRFAPSYIPGAGMLDGETIETLWSLLKGMIGSTRGMSTSHRKEVLDDHMNDVNWEKTTRVGELISVSAWTVITLTANSPTVRATINRYNAAVTGVQNSVAEFRSLCESTPDNLIEDWTKLEKKAQKARRAVHDAPSSEDKNALLARLQIYDVTPRNCTSSILFVPYQRILTP